MTTTPPDAATGATDAPPPGVGHATYGPRVSRDDIRDVGALRRTVGPDRRIAGVAGGLARHLDVDPVILRVAFVVLALFGGAGLIVYGAVWLLVPEDGSDRRPLGLSERNRGIALIIAGTVAAVVLLAHSADQVGFPWPLAVCAGVVLLVLMVMDRRRDRSRPTAPPVPHRPVSDQPGAAWAPAAPTTSSYAVTDPVAPPTYQPAYQSGYQSTYQSTYQPGYQPTYQPATPPVRTWTNPRRRGPILFWFTLALAALGIGALAVVDLAGVHIAAGAYPAVVVGACGLMLLVGAFYGRAGGLSFVGVLAALVMAGASLTGTWSGSDTRHQPVAAADVQDSYSFSTGRLVLDLRDVADPEALAGRTVSVTGRVGDLLVIVPDTLGVTVDAHVSRAGDITLFGSDDGGGFGVDATHSHAVTDPAGALTIDAHLIVGQIEVRAERPGTLPPSAKDVTR